MKKVKSVSDATDHKENMEKTMEKKRNLRKQMTKAVLTVAAVIGCFSVMMITCYAYTPTTGTVIPATAKIRAEANTESAVVGSTAAGKTVSITDEVKAADGSVWYQVFVDAANKGYIRSDLVTKAGGAAPAQLPAAAPAASPAVTPAAETPKTEAAPTAVTNTDWQSAKVSSKSVIVRKEASTAADRVAAVGRGTTVTVTGKAKGADGQEWYQVSFSYNNATITGFIRSDLVTFGELEEESPEPAVTEITGTKEDASKEEADKKPADAEEPGTEEAETEPAAEPSTVEQEPQPEPESQPAEPVNTVTVLNAEETPPLAAGFKEVSVTLNDQKVRAWKNGDFYIFYGQSASGETGFYMYDSIETNYQRYYMSNIEDAGKQGGLSGNVQTIILIVLGILVVALLVVITLLTIKLNDYKSELDWEEGDDDEDDDDMQEDEEEEEIIQLPKRVKKQVPVAEDRTRHPHPSTEPRRRPQSSEEPRRRPQVTEEPKRRPQSQEEPKRRPQPTGEQRRPAKPGGDTGSRPRNFLAEDEMEGKKAALRKGKEKKYETKPRDLDPEDEDTFVFINLDGDQID